MLKGETGTPPATSELTVGGGRVLGYCCYGPADGLPVVSLAGTPGTRWERPDVIAAFEQAGLRVAAPDRPGYGGSTPQPGRTVASVAADVQMIADAHGWPQFAVTGFSGGGPHALACAALLAGRVTCCAAVATPAPADAADVDFFAAHTPDFRLAVRSEQALRGYLQARASDAMAQFESDNPAPPSGPAQTSSSASRQAAADPGRTARIRAMFLGGLDGWVDDHIALIRPWGFDLAGISVPVSLWHGTQDTRVPRAHTDWLLAHLPSAQVYEHSGGHDPSDATYRQILGWITATAGMTA
jgi:pimeloyl-ACP methyl ester carboxylesterase